MSSIFNLSEASAIGLHSCVLLAKDPQSRALLSAREIAQQLDVSYDHTVLVLQRLRQAGILESIQGPQGGFRLVKSPAEVTVLMIYEVLEGTLTDRRCLFRQEKCKGDCPLFGELTTEISRIARKFFTETTLQMLVEKKQTALYEPASA